MEYDLFASFCVNMCVTVLINDDWHLTGLLLNPFINVLHYKLELCSVRWCAVSWYSVLSAWWLSNEVRRVTTLYLGWVACNFPAQLHQSVDWLLHLLCMGSYSGWICVPTYVCVRELCICLHLPFYIFEGNRIYAGWMLLYLREDGGCSKTLTFRWWHYIDTQFSLKK